MIIRKCVIKVVYNSKKNTLRKQTRSKFSSFHWLQLRDFMHNIHDYFNKEIFRSCYDITPENFDYRSQTHLHGKPNLSSKDNWTLWAQSPHTHTRPVLPMCGVSNMYLNIYSWIVFHLTYLIHMPFNTHEITLNVGLGFLINTPIAKDRAPPLH